jgi:hypothetical protein
MFLAGYWFISSTPSIKVSLLDSGEVLEISNAPASVKSGDTIVVIKIIHRSETKASEVSWAYVDTDPVTRNMIKEAIAKQSVSTRVAYFKAKVL